MLKIFHNQLGILIAPFIFIVALTGVLYGLTPRLETFIYQEQLVATHKSAQQSKPISQQVAAALPYLPSKAKILAVRTPANSALTMRILYRSSAESNQTLAIFVNPYTLQVQGQLAVYGTSGVLLLRTFLDDLHRSLLLGDIGRIYSEFAASWLGIFALTGLIQWRYSRKQPRSTHVRPSYLRLHCWLGLLVLPMLVFFSVTGLTWSKWSGANIAQIRHWLGSDTPTLELSLLTAPSIPIHDLHAEHHHGAVMESMTTKVQHPTLIQFDEIITIARQHGLSATALQIEPSYDPQQAW